MKRTLFVVIVVVMLLFSAVSYSFALTKDVNVTAAIGNVFSMTIGPTDPATVDFGTIADPTLPTAGGTSPVVTVKSNKLWKFEYHAPVSFTNSGGSTTPMPIDKMSWTAAVPGGSSVSPAGGAFVGTAAGVYTQLAAAEARGNNAYTFSYSLTPGLDYDPGDYAATVTYQATQN
jgi:hypothetical protein